MLNHRLDCLISSSGWRTKLPFLKGLSLPPHFLLFPLPKVETVLAQELMGFRYSCLNCFELAVSWHQMLLSSCCMQSAIDENVVSSVAIFDVVFLQDKYFKTLWKTGGKCCKRQWAYTLEYVILTSVVGSQFPFEHERVVTPLRAWGGSWDRSENSAGVNNPIPLWHLWAAEYAMNEEHWLFILGSEAVREHYCDTTQDQQSQPAV